MKILVLGGTGFLGRTFVEHAIARGHELTLFNRGQRNPDLFPNVEQIHGDRSVDLNGLTGRSWDAVFDTSGYFPRVVGMSAEKLRGKVGSYQFISSISVFKNFDLPNQDESGELASLEGPVVEEITGETYGALKVLCEQAVEESFGEGAVIVRPGLIVGPYDYSDRFAYWPVRMERGGDVLVPNTKNLPVQIIDVRDLSRWCLDLFENQASGIFNATGPQTPYRFEEVLTACATGTQANLVWVDCAFLEEQGVQPWSELPFVVSFDGSGAGLCQIDVSRAVQAGLTFRPLAETIQDTRVWARTRPSDHVWQAGLTAERESELLEAFKLNQASKRASARLSTS